MPFIPDDVYAQLIALGLKTPHVATWQGRAPLTASLHGNHWLACRCTPGKQVCLKHIVIRGRSLGIGQCSNCGLILWRDWEVVETSAGGFSGRWG